MYEIKKIKGARPYTIVNTETKKVVGTSKTLKNAKGSIAHRMDYYRKQENKPKSKSPTKRIVRNKKVKGRTFKPLTNKNKGKSYAK